jgi:hypothetical protein
MSRKRRGCGGAEETEILKSVRNRRKNPVIPAQAGIQTTRALNVSTRLSLATFLAYQSTSSAIDSWIPACAGMTQTAAPLHLRTLGVSHSSP